MYETFTTTGDLQQLTLRSTFPQELVQQVGAPEVMWTVITCPGGRNDSASPGSSSRGSATNSSPSSSSSSGDSEGDDDLQVAVVWQNKTPTRLPEALWFSFQPNPDVIDVDSWRMHKLRSLVSPMEVGPTKSYAFSVPLIGTICIWLHVYREWGSRVNKQDHTPLQIPSDCGQHNQNHHAATASGVHATAAAAAANDAFQVILNGSQSMHAVSEAGVQVDSADRSELLQIRTLDTALVSPSHPNPFPNGVFAPCMQEGMHFNLVNNIWGTNYVMWVPYSKDDVNMAFRFSVHAEKRQQLRQQQQQQQRWPQHESV